MSEEFKMKFAVSGILPGCLPWYCYDKGDNQVDVLCEVLHSSNLVLLMENTNGAIKAKRSYMF